MPIDRRTSEIECPDPDDGLARSFYLRLAKSAGYGSDAFRGLMLVTVNIRKKTAVARGRKRAGGRKKTRRSRGR